MSLAKKRKVVRHRGHKPYGEGRYVVWYVCERCGREYHDPRDAANCPCIEYENQIRNAQILSQRMYAAIRRLRSQQPEKGDATPVTQFMAEPPYVGDPYEAVEEPRRISLARRILMASVSPWMIVLWIALAASLFYVLFVESIWSLMLAGAYMIAAGFAMIMAIIEAVFPSPEAWIEPRFDVEIEKPYGRIRLYAKGDPRKLVYN